MKKNIIFNEDCNHLVFTREKGGLPHLTREEIVSFIQQYKDTGIKALMLDFGAPNPWFRSKSVRGIMETYPDYIARGGKRIPYVDYLIDFYEREGTDVQTVFFSAAREAGLSPHISFRMSDVHEGFCEDSFLWSDFYRAHRMKYNTVPHRTPAAYLEYCLNYHFEEVVEHMFSLIKEGLETFDADGLELDFLREAYLFGYGKEQEGIAIMNAFIRRVRKALDEAERKWGHPLTLSVRMPDSPIKALRLGFDVLEWARAGLIDRVAVSARWASTDTAMPIDFWARILKGTGVTLAAGLEILMRAHPTATPFGHSYETAVGTALAYLSQGADEVYLFNFFDFYNGVSNVPYFGIDTELYQRFLSLAGNKEALQNEPRRHVVTYNDMPATGEVQNIPLPVKLELDRTAATPFHSNVLYTRLRVITGKIPADKTVKVVLGFAQNTEYDVEDLTLYLNQIPCTYLGKVEAYRPAPDGLDYLAFSVPNDGTLPDVSVIELGFAHGKTVLEWAEIAVN